MRALDGQIPAPVVAVGAIERFVGLFDDIPVPRFVGLVAFPATSGALLCVHDALVLGAGVRRCRRGHGHNG